jgi:peptidoglycan/LPS O-acetylase OafA/YrhL
MLTFDPIKSVNQMPDLPRVEYRPDIDGLRAVAVVAVLLFHAGVPGFSGGYSGVDMFFVISGYLVSAQILLECRMGRFSLLQFWARRIRRIVPALALVMLVTVVVGWFLLFPLNYRDLGRSIVSQTVFGSNIFFWLKAGYFAAPSETKPLLHTWSVSLEEEFYLFIPILLYLALRRGRRVTMLVLAGCFVVSFGYSAYQSSRYPDAAFYLLPSRMWELLIGCILATVSIKPASARGASMIAAVGAAGVLASVPIDCSGWRMWPAPIALVPCLATALLITSGPPANSAINRVLAMPLLVTVGVRSYSLYLWHWPLLAFARYSSVSPLSVWQCLLVIACSIPLAELSFRLIERPCRRWRLVQGPQIAFSFGGAALAACCGLGFVVAYFNGFPGRHSDQAALVTEMATAAQNRASYCDGPALSDSRGGGAFVCRLGSVKNDRPVVLVVGDSFAGMYLQVIRELSEKSDTEVWFNKEPNQPIRPLIVEAVRMGRVRAVVLCYSWRRALQGGLPELASQESGQSAGGNPMGFSLGLLFADRMERFEADLIATAEQVHLLGVRVYLVDAPPYYPTHVPLKIALMLQRGVDPTLFGTSLASHTNELRPVHDVFVRIERRDLATVIWTAKALADEQGLCRTYIDGRCLYSDDGHLSYEGASLVAQSLQTVFAPVP